MSWDAWAAPLTANK